MGLFTPVEELKGRLVDAYGNHVLTPHIVAKATSGSGDSSTTTLIGLCGKGIWDGIEKLWWRGEVLPETSYHFHNGFIPVDPEDSTHGGAQAPDTWFTNAGNYSGIAYVTVRIPTATLSDNDFSTLKVQARCKRVMDYDSSGNELGLIFSTNPALVWADIFLRANRRPNWRINWTSWTAWKVFCAESLVWEGGTLPGRPTYQDLTGFTLLANGGLYSDSTGFAKTTSIFLEASESWFDFDLGSSSPGYSLNVGLVFTGEESPVFNLQFRNGGLYITELYICAAGAGDRFRLKVLADGTIRVERYGETVFTGTESLDKQANILITASGQTEIIRALINPLNAGTRQRERFIAGLAFTDKTDIAAALEACLYVSCTNIQDVNGSISFVLPEASHLAPRATTFHFTDAIVKNARPFTISAEQKIPKLTGVIRDIDTPEWKEVRIDVIRDELAASLEIYGEENQVNLGTMTQGQAKCVLNYQVRMTCDLDLFLDVEASAESFVVAPGDMVLVTLEQCNWDSVRCLVISSTDDDAASTADTRKFVLQVVPSAPYSDADQTPLIPNVTDAPPSSIAAPPVALSVQAQVITEVGANNTITTSIRGSVTFNPAYNGYQRARLYIQKPSDTQPYLSPLTVDVNNNSFEFVANSRGVYQIFAVTENSYGTRNTEPITNHANTTVNVSDVDVTLPAPVSPQANFSVNTIEYRWSVGNSVNLPFITKYTIWSSSDAQNGTLVRTVAAPALSGQEVLLSGTSSTMFRWIRAEDDLGNVSAMVAFNGGAAITVINLPAPSGYQVVFNGTGEFIHTWNALGLPNIAEYQISNNTNFVTILGRSSSTSFIQRVSNAGGRTYSFYLRAVDNLGNVGTATSVLEVNVPIIPAPVISPDPNREYPWNAFVLIAPPVVDERRIIETVVETSEGADFGDGVLQTYRIAGLAREADISGRFASQPTLYVRARYVDFFGEGDNSNITSLTFPLIGGSDIYPKTIRTDHLIVGGLSDNLILNPSFEIQNIAGGLPEGWNPYGAGTAQSYLQHPSGTGRYMRLGHISGLTARVFPVSPGDDLAYRFRAKSINGGSFSAYFNFIASIPASNFIGDGTNQTPVFTAQIQLLNAQAAAAGWTSYEGNISVPANVYYAAIVIVSAGASGTSVDFDDCVAKKQIGDAFIHDLRADKITASQGDFGIIFADTLRQRNHVSYQRGSGYALDTVGDGNATNQWSYDQVNKEFVTSGSGGTSGANYTSIFANIAAYALLRGDGYGEFELNQINKDFIIGLTQNSSPGDSGDILAGFKFNGSTHEYSIFDGVSTFNKGTMAASAIYRIAVEEGRFRFRVNGKLIYTSPFQLTNQYPLYFAASHNGATVGRISKVKLAQSGYGKGWKLNPLSGASINDSEPTWSTLTASSQGNDGALIKSGGVAGWNSGATAYEVINTGDGFIQTVVPDQDAHEFQIVLSQGGSAGSINPTDADFGLRLKSDKKLAVVERGSIITYLPDYELGQIIRVAIEGGKVKYRIDGQVLYESTNSSWLVTDYRGNYSSPVRFKALIYQGSDFTGAIRIASETSGSGEFNSGLTVKGVKLEDIADTVSQAFKNKVYRGHDTDIPESYASFIDFHDVWIPFQPGEEQRAMASIFINVDDFQTNPSRNMASIDHVRCRIYNKFGELVLPYGFMYFPWNGRGVASHFFYKRDNADPYLEAVFALEFHNLYGYSKTLYWTGASWVTASARAGTFVNYGLTPPIWKNRRTCPTNLTAVPSGSNSVTLNWINAESAPDDDHDVYFRKYKSSDYTSTSDWIKETSTLGGRHVFTDLIPNTRYEFMVESPYQTGDADVQMSSPIVQCATFPVEVAPPVYPTPINITVSIVSGTALDLRWSANGSPTSTEISRRTGSGSWSVISSAYTGSQPYHDTSLSQGTTYDYRLRNNYSGNFSGYSQVVSGMTSPALTPANTPSNLSGIAISPYAARIYFSANGGANHTLQFVSDGQGWGSPNTRSGISNPYTLGGLMPDSSYRMRVRAESSTQSGWSNEFIFSTDIIGGDGDGRGCVVPETLTIKLVLGKKKNVPVSSIFKGDTLISITDCGSMVESLVTDVIKTKSDVLYVITTESGRSISCSPSHPVLRGFGDTHGSHAELLNEGDVVLVLDGDVAKQEQIASIAKIELLEEIELITFQMADTSHTFLTNGIVSHNVEQK